jgi:hypothetical protein
LGARSQCAKGECHADATIICQKQSIAIQEQHVRDSLLQGKGKLG